MVDVDVVSSPADQGQLYNISSKAKEELGIEELGVEELGVEESEINKLIVLADKGYYSGEDLEKCEKNHMVTIVARPKLPSHDGNEEYSKDKFKYNKEEDSYTCPQGHKLTSGSKESTTNKVYKNFAACKNCPAKNQCTKAERGRKMIRGPCEEVFERADTRYDPNKPIYRLRQMIVEHVFGTIKRGQGFSYFLLRGNKKVKAESYMHFLGYNLKRVINIIGGKKIIEHFKALILCCFYWYRNISAINGKIRVDFVN